MRRYALQLSGHDFEPSSHWSTDIRPVVNELVTRDDVDLLMWDPATDASEIYEQYSLATLMGQIETSAYARLLTTMGQVLVERQGLPFSAPLSLPLSAPPGSSARTALRFHPQFPPYVG